MVIAFWCNDHPTLPQLHFSLQARAKMGNEMTEADMLEEAGVLAKVVESLRDYVPYSVSLGTSLLGRTGTSTVGCDV